MKKEVPFLVGVGIIVLAAIIAGWALYATAPSVPETQLVPTTPSISTTTSQSISGPGGPCGGNTTHPLGCVVGYHCAPRPNSHLPFGDVGGICISDAASTNSTATFQVKVGCSIVNGHTICY